MPHNTNPLYENLVALGKCLATEMRYNNYPKEWATPPLKSLLPKFYTALNYHPHKLGDILSEAFADSYPEKKKFNVNVLPDEYPTLFGTGKTSYVPGYPYREESIAQDAPLSDLSSLPRDLKTLAAAIIQTFAELTPNQENQHRTLEKVSIALEPVMRSNNATAMIGSELKEFVDYWRPMNAAERQAFAGKILRDWAED